MQTLLLGNSNIGEFIDSKPKDIFRNNINLEILDVSACNLKSRFPGKIISPLTNLKVLNISKNPHLRNIEGLKKHVKYHF